MKNNFLLPFIAIGLLMTACGEKAPSNAFKIEGVVADSTLSGKYVYLDDMSNRRTLDSVQVANGKFVFEGKADTVRICALRGIGNMGRMYVPLIIEVGMISIDIEKNTAKGTPLNDELSKFNAQKDSIINILWAESDSIRSKEKDKEKQGKMYEDFYAQWKPGFTKLIHSYLDANANNVIGAVVIDDLSSSATTDEMDAAFAKLGKEILNNPMVKRASDANTALKTTAEGQPFVDFTGENAKKEKVSLSDYVGKGKYILVDFWASWCGPCRAETPNIKAVYAQYKNKGLQVVSAAVWDKPEDTLKAIEEDKLPWAQMINCGEETTKLYGIRGIPHIILFGPDGKIVARNLRGDKMRAKIAEVLK